MSSKTHFFVKGLTFTSDKELNKFQDISKIYPILDKKKKKSDTRKFCTRFRFLIKIVNFKSKVVIVNIDIFGLMLFYESTEILCLRSKEKLLIIYWYLYFKMYLEILS